MKKFIMEILADFGFGDITDHEACEKIMAILSGHNPAENEPIVLELGGGCEYYGHIPKGKDLEKIR